MKPQSAKTKTIASSEISGEMTISDLFERYPSHVSRLTSVLEKNGLSCSGCHVNAYETLAQGVASHGLPSTVTKKLVQELNNVVRQKAAPATGITVTKAAASKIKELQAKEKKQGYGLRVGIVSGGCSGSSYSLGFEQQATQGDKVITHDGISLFVDPASAPLLDGVEIDYVEGLQGSGFKINNPHAKSTCGCGHSSKF